MAELYSPQHLLSHVLYVQHLSLLSQVVGCGFSQQPVGPWSAGRRSECGRFVVYSRLGLLCYEIIIIIYLHFSSN